MRFALVVLLAACTQERVYALDELPVRDWTAGLPVTGDGRLLVWLAPSRPRVWSNVVGFVRFRCDGCTLGDGRTPLKLAMFGDIAFGRITFGTVRASADFANGRVKLTSTWRSPDFELDARVDGILARRAADIALDGCVVFRPTAALLARDPKTHAVISATGAPLGPNDTYSIKLTGTLGKMRRLAQVCTVAR